MKEEIKKLIEQQKTYKEECFEQANELLKINKEKLSDEEKSLLKDSVLLLENEISIRNSIISDLEGLL